MKQYNLLFLTLKRQPAATPPPSNGPKLKGGGEACASEQHESATLQNGLSIGAMAGSGQVF
jgi:hypothetical protein